MATRPRTSLSPARLRTPWAWAVAGALLGLGTTVVLQAPARWLGSALEQLSAGQVVLAEARGTVWTGSARLQFSGGAGSRDQSALPGRISWQLRPAGLGLDVQLDADCCTAQPLRLNLAPRWGGARLQLQDSPAPQQPSIWPAALLVGLGAPWNTMQVEGQLSLSTHDLSVDWAQGRPSVTGSAELRAVGMSSRLSPLKPMGSYRIAVQGGSTTTLDLTTLEGSLQLSGTGRWIGSRLHFEGEASAAPDREAALSNLLNILGRRKGARSIISVG